MFHDYYIKYLGIENGTLVNGCRVCRSENRDIPLNKRYIYRIIITDYNNERIVSLSKTISENKINTLCADMKERTLDDIPESPQLCWTGLRLDKMYRMVLHREITFPGGWVIPSKSEYIASAKKYVIRDNGNIVSYCKISNIDYKYGNIVVWTEESFRRRGFARELLLLTIHKCKSEGIEPVYLVKSQNLASLELARSVGFEIVQTEIIACEENGIPSVNTKTDYPV